VVGAIRPHAPIPNCRRKELATSENQNTTGAPVLCIPPRKPALKLDMSFGDLGTRRDIRLQNGFG
jgi:hypothetical protein